LAVRKPVCVDTHAENSPRQLEDEDSYTSVPEFNETGLAFVLDQDTDNFLRQRAGMKAAVKLGQTLGNYQESRIRAFHHTLDDYLA
jgi:hypothetical protein